WLVTFSLALIVLTIASFAYALRGVTGDKASEIAQGAALAVVALAAVGFVFWRVARYLNAESKRSGGPEREPAEPKRSNRHSLSEHRAATRVARAAVTRGHVFPQVKSERNEQWNGHQGWHHEKQIPHT